MKKPESARIQTIIVNHNTSIFTELALRSLFAMDANPSNIAVEIHDNHSDDDGFGDLEIYAKEKSIPILTTIWNTHTPINSHGEILREFVLNSCDADYFLFLDADIVFCRNNTLKIMMEELRREPDAFAVSARMSWDGKVEMPRDADWTGKKWLIDFAGNFESPPEWNSRDDLQHAITKIMDRCNPFCCLIRNSSQFQAVAREIGFSAATTWANEDGKHWDTFGLATTAMKAMGNPHIVSSEIVYHFCQVTYDGEWLEAKRSKCLRYLEHFREHYTFNPEIG